MSREKQLLKIIKFLINNYSFKDVIDIGCGEATYVDKFVKNDINYTGVDITLSRTPKELISRKNVNLIEENILKYKNIKKFDCVFSCHSIEHFPNTEFFLKSFFAHIKEFGVFCLIWPPPKDNIVSGHVHCFSMGLMLYNLVRLGIDCRNVKMIECGYNLAILGSYKLFKLPKLTHNEGDIGRLSKYFPFEAYQGFDGKNIPEILKIRV